MSLKGLRFHPFLDVLTFGESVFRYTPQVSRHTFHSCLARELFTLYVLVIANMCAFIDVCESVLPLSGSCSHQIHGLKPTEPGCHFFSPQAGLHLHDCRIKNPLDLQLGRVTQQCTTGITWQTWVWPWILLAGKIAGFV